MNPRDAKLLVLGLCDSDLGLELARQSYDQGFEILPVTSFNGSMIPVHLQAQADEVGFALARGGRHEQVEFITGSIEDHLREVTDRSTVVVDIRNRNPAVSVGELVGSGFPVVLAGGSFTSRVYPKDSAQAVSK